MGFGRNLAIIAALISSLGLPSWAPADDSINPVFAPKDPPTDFIQANIFQDLRFFTMASDSNEVGPIYPYRTSDFAQTQDYVMKVFRHLVVKADQVTQGHPEIGNHPGANNQPYYAFMVLALTVPQHESRLVHFREATGEICSEQANGLLTQPPSSRRVLWSIYRNPLTPIFPDCRFFSKGDKVTQLLSSPTGDTGIMQVNAHYHASAFEPAMMLNVYRSIDYGVQYLWTGFEEVHANFGKFQSHCNFKKNPFKGRDDSKENVYWNLDRGIWAGRYNSHSVCRFTTNDENDVNFQNTLSSIVREDSSMYHAYLPEGSLERRAFLEIVANYRSAFSSKKIKEQNSALRELLGQNEIIDLWQAPGRLQQDPTHILRKGRINLQAIMNDKEAFTCGQLSSAGEGEEKVQVFSMSTDRTGQHWSEIIVPPYTNFATFDAESPAAKQCNNKNHYFVHSTDLKRLAVTMEPGRHYKAVIIGVGHSSTNVHLAPSVNSAIVDVVQPGRRIEIINSLLLNNKEEWCQIQPGDNSYSEAWVRCDKHRVAPVSEIKPPPTPRGV